MVTLPDAADLGPELCPSCQQPIAGGHGADCPEAPAPLDESNAETMLGRIIDHRYQLEALLGIGGMGIVYRARHILIDKRVALKVLRRPRDERSRQRFREEARIVSSIEHEAVVSVLDYGILEDGRPYLVMTLIAGQNLAEALRAGPFAPARACRIAAQAAQGLAAVHAHGVVHRDVKPENLILSPRAEGEQVHLIDFGIALLSTTKRVTKEGAVVGTLRYIAPEQRSGRGADAFSDQYALGIVLLELLTGQPPTSAALDEEPGTSRRSRRWLAGVRGASESLERIVGRMLAVKKAERFPSMDAVASALLAEAARLTVDAPAAPTRPRSLSLGLGGLAVVAAVASGLSIGLWSLLTAFSSPPQVAAVARPAEPQPEPRPQPPIAPAESPAERAPDSRPAASPAVAAAEPALLLAPRPHPPARPEPSAPKPARVAQQAVAVEPVAAHRGESVVLELRILQPPDDEVRIVCAAGGSRSCQRRCELDLPRAALTTGKATCTITAAGFRPHLLTLPGAPAEATGSERLRREVSLDPIQLEDAP